MKTLIFTLLIINFQSAVADDSSKAIKAQGGTGYQINLSRTFEVDENTLFMEDGKPSQQPDAQGGTGYKIRYQISDTNPNLTSGTFEEIDFINTHMGPVLSVDPLQIFNIEGATSSKTYFANGLSQAGLSVGDTVLISGYVDSHSLSVMTRVEVVPSLTEWKLSGYVENLSNNQFSINNQWIQFSPSDVGACNASLANHDYVEVFADPVSGFVLNDTINSVTQINCVDRSVQSNSPNGTVIVVGMIDELDDDDGFVLSGQQVVVDQLTRYIRGRAEDIQERISIEVEGTVDDVSGIISADKIRFFEDRINLTLPVTPNDFTYPFFNVAGASLQVTPQTLDPDGVITNGINESIQLQFKGYDHGDGELIVTRLYARGEVDYDGVKINGNVSAINDPIVDLFGVSLDTTSSLFYDDIGTSISAVEFFESITVGSEVNVEDATLDENSGLIAGGNVFIEKLASNKVTAGYTNKNGNPTVAGVGHITGGMDQIFNGGFDDQ
ncbi:DUF5666 domain-containing protein [Marinicella litoralis]|nr:DUF5666 domain-containing protein [Marinicella litoralis]